MQRRTLLKMAGLAGFAALPITVAGCGGSQTESSAGATGDAGGEVSYWFWQDDSTDTTWQDLAEQFNSSQDRIHVNLQTIPLAQYQDQLVSALSSGTGPDACRFKDWWLGQLVSQKAIDPLDDYVNSWDGKTDVVEGLWATGKVPGDDTVYMLPHQFVTIYMYYRKSFFAEIDMDAPVSHEDVLAASEKLTDAGANRYGLDVRGGAGGQDQWAAWMLSGGAKMVDDSGQVILNDSTAAKVNQDYLDIESRLHAAPPGSISAAFAQVTANFQGGQTAMLIHHPGSLAAMREALGDDLGVVKMPGDGPTLGTMSGNVLLSSSQNKDAAWEWMSWLSSKEPMLTMSKSAQGQLPVLTSSREDEFYQSDEALQVALQAQETAVSWPALPGTSNVANATWSPAIQAAFLGQTTSQEMLDQLASDMSK
ncbi:sugar ABC transporter substrate-binding protein [Propionimicrobium sp. PCR01-08-3]|uniref:ABC transporter substrate-binding protein n=1 Tax=Propionimicrobium sp. PCR01-08-3 TaxID=3052086 RepID=UPI00255CE0FC|nr:sugar ABC transporter substrate-binding protein [Propionimicrobium sp. PCR01-08-3]WIY83485.1 sugar ABC transporter substrate-binding protein [Propionimicrobium sp. PCR01-08-3]